MYYYHLTTEKNLNSILKQGILPKIGERSALNMEKKPSIYLCNYHDLPIWSFLLGLPITIQIPKESVTIDNTFEYQIQTEYITYKPISQKGLSTIKTPKLDKTMQNEIVTHLCMALSTTLTRLAIFYERYQNDTELLNHILQSLNCVGYMISQVPWNDIDCQNLQNELKKSAESGEYIFTDTYKDTNKRLWEQVLFYPESDQKICKSYQQFIQNIASMPTKIKFLSTGGWTTD